MQGAQSFKQTYESPGAKSVYDLVYPRSTRFDCFVQHPVLLICDYQLRLLRYGHRTFYVPFETLQLLLAMQDDSDRCIM